MKQNITTLGALTAVVCFRAFVLAGDELPAHVILLARAQHRLEADLKRLPAFACMETIERFVRSKPKDRWKASDIVRVEVAQIGDKELFSWPGEDQFQEKGLGDIVGIGLTASGDFANYARSIALNTSVRWKFHGMEELRGRKAARYDFEVPVFLADFHISHEGNTGSAGERGSYWIDSETQDLLRIAFQAIDLPPNVALLDAWTQVDYGRVRIGGQDLLLPQHTATGVLTFGGTAKRNETEFSHCRQFSAQSKLILDPEQSDAAGTAAVQRNVIIPPGTDVVLVLEQEVSSTAPIGQELNAHLADAIGTLVPKGARVTGRIRRMDKVGDRTAWAFGLEFTRIEWPGGKASFFGELQSPPNVSGASRMLQSTRTRISAFGDGTVTTTSNEEINWLTQVPGVGSFLIEGLQPRLPAGTHLRWRTVDPK